jgi:hypothetical protein
MNLKDLKKEIPYQWRVQSFSKFDASATCVAYIDARDVMNLLDEVVGSECWQSDFKDIGGQTFAGIGINTAPINGGQWVWKWDTGSESNIEKEKGQASDSLKRAAVQWGIGRFLYELEVRKVKTNEAKKDGNYPYVVDDNGKRVWNLTDHINKGSKTPKTAPKSVEAVNTVQSILSLRQQAEKDIKEEDDIFGLNNLNDRIQKSTKFTPEEKKELNFMIDAKLETIQPF